MTSECVRHSALMEIAGRLRDAALLIERRPARAADLTGNFKQLAVDQGCDHVVALDVTREVRERLF